MGNHSGDAHASRGSYPGRHPLRPAPSPLGRMASGTVILVWTIAILFGTAPHSIGQLPSEDGVDQIEARIRRQREENLRAVRSLIDRLSLKFDEQRAGLAKDEARLRSLGDFPLPDPHFDLPALEAQREGRLEPELPRPSPGAPQPRRMEIAPGEPGAPGPEIPLLPPPRISPFDLDPPDDKKLSEAREALLLGERIKERRIAMRKIVSELVRARALLRDLGDDGVPPPPALTTVKSAPGGKEAPLKPERIVPGADRKSDSQAARRERPKSGP